MDVESIHNKLPEAVKGRRRDSIPEAYRKVAKGMEEQFLQHMIEQMRKTIDFANAESSSLKFYQSMLNSSHANVMAQKNYGKGLQKVILDQIYPVYKRNTPRGEGVVNHYREHNNE